MEIRFSNSVNCDSVCLHVAMQTVWLIDSKKLKPKTTSFYIYIYIYIYKTVGFTRVDRVRVRVDPSG